MALQKTKVIPMCIQVCPVKVGVSCQGVGDPEEEKCSACTVYFPTDCDVAIGDIEEVPGIAYLDGNDVGVDEVLAPGITETDPDFDL